MKCYAGIGARRAPPEIRVMCKVLASELAERGYTLRSGHADGCDIAFEMGASSKQIFLPWKSFNGSDSKYWLPSTVPQKLIDIAKSIYPAWDYVSDGVRRMHCRNVQQILGENADDPSGFVACWTDRNMDRVGGTVFGIVLAQQNNIPVFNLFVPEEEDKLIQFMKSR
jgi:hypothetical protein